MYVFSIERQCAVYCARVFSEGILVGFPVRRHKRFVDLLNANAQPMINSDAWEASREPKIPCFGSRLRRYEARY
jgi:hypothetical protein